MQPPAWVVLLEDEAVDGGRGGVDHGGQMREVERGNTDGGLWGHLNMFLAFDDVGGVMVKV